ncbi:MAG: T9SS type A sorting domain-containing protein [Ignavibacteriae bacterium]|nr:T9SS type A sorting domain-containing protein [Ignavibacteriota bacterium]
MKKLIYIIILTFLITASLPAQKVNFTLNNARIDVDKFLVDVYANVNPGQIWNVGPTCIRMRYWTTDPVNAITLIAEDPVTNANTNLSNNANYFDMTSTSILGDTCVSLNIQQLLNGTAFSLSSGAYWLGTLRFNIVTANSCINMAFLTNSSVFNGLGTPMAHTTDWTFTNPGPCMTSAVNQISTEVPTTYTLSQNYPNPFNPTTSIKFSIPKSGFVSLKVYDILGRQVADLVNQVKSSGTYIVDFDASTLTSGMYFYKFEANDFVSVKKMVLIK